MSYKILIINPGSTSTKIGVYEDETQLMEETLRHTTEEIAQYDTIYDQKDFRKNVILDVLKEKDVDYSTSFFLPSRSSNNGGMAPHSVQYSNVFSGNRKVYLSCFSTHSDL